LVRLNPGPGANGFLPAKALRLFPHATCASAARYQAQCRR
jgi:hypothetical protein